MMIDELEALMDDIYFVLEDEQQFEEVMVVNGVAINLTLVFTPSQIDVLNGAFMEDGEWNATELEYIVSLARRDR